MCSRVDEEIIIAYHGKFRGKRGFISSFRTEATGMYLSTYLICETAKKTDMKPKVRLCPDNKFLIKRVQKLAHHAPVAIFMKNEHGMYCGMR